MKDTYGVMLITLKSKGSGYILDTMGTEKVHEVIMTISY